MKYGLKIMTGPSVEPVTVAEAKAHLRLEHSADDTLIGSLITAARLFIESVTSRAFMTQTLMMTLQCFPACGRIDLVRSPVQTVSHIKYLDSAGALQTLDSANYALSAGREPAQIWKASNGTYPLVLTDNPNAVQVTYVAGYGNNASDVPENVKQAIKFLVSHWYENRETVTSSNFSEMPLALQALINQISITQV